MKALVLSALIALGALPAHAANEPEQLVRQLYAMKQIPLKSREIDRFFAQDLAAAIKRDIAPRDEVGQTNDGDYRYNAQEFEITDLKFQNATNQAGGTVTASFKNFGKAETVTYAICRAKSGWKIADVRATGWGMREVLKLPASPVRC